MATHSTNPLPRPTTNPPDSTSSEGQSQSWAATEASLIMDIVLGIFASTIALAALYFTYRQLRIMRQRHRRFSDPDLEAMGFLNLNKSKFQNAKHQLSSVPQYLQLTSRVYSFERYGICT